MTTDLHPGVGETADEQTAQTPIEVLLADDHVGVRRQLRRLLEAEGGLDVLGEADDPFTALGLANAHPGVVLLIDMPKPYGSLIETIQRLRGQSPHAEIVLVTMEHDRAFVRSALQAGVLGYVLKEHADTDLVQAVRCAAHERQYVSPSLAARL